MSSPRRSARNAEAAGLFSWGVRVGGGCGCAGVGLIGLSLLVTTTSVARRLASVEDSVSVVDPSRHLETARLPGSGMGGMYPGGRAGKPHASQISTAASTSRPAAHTELPTHSEKQRVHAAERPAEASQAKHTQPFPTAMRACAHTLQQLHVAGDTLDPTLESSASGGGAGRPGAVGHTGRYGEGRSILRNEYPRADWRISAEWDGLDPQSEDSVRLPHVKSCAAVAP
mmetsp:Transcript_2760/g.8494  ORF Transcript_2760/g.8494 Transcript_2760/m.8494 type:complete len:228 (+) Transcript_2760:1-684(+)